MGKGADKYKRLLKSAVKNLTKSFYDSYVKENARFRAEAGLKVTVIREELGECCDWCADLAGVYEYGTEPKDVWARHLNCNCMVTCKTEKGKYQDAWSRREFETQREARIAREQEILEEQREYAKKLKHNILDIDAGRNITAEYIEKARIQKGIITFEDNYDKELHKNEIEIGNWIKDTFGGNLVFKCEVNQNRIKTPDYIWNNKMWELKCPTTETAADSALRKGLKQIEGNPGGIILNYGERIIDYKALEKRLKSRMQWNNGKTIDIIIKCGEKFAVLRFN